jgi:hypothetical protein
VNAFTPAAGYYRAALVLWPGGRARAAAGLLRLLGTALLEAGDLGAVEAVLVEGAEVAAAGRAAVRAQIGVLLAATRNVVASPKP